MIGRKVRLTVRRERFTDPSDAAYVLREGKYADPKYGSTVNGGVFTVTGEVEGLLQLADDNGTKVYLAEPGEVSW